MNVEKEQHYERKERRASKRRSLRTAVTAGALTLFAIGGSGDAASNQLEAVDTAAASTQQARRLETIVIGDSIGYALCDGDLPYRCNTFPGLWVSNGFGENLLQRAIDGSEIDPGDTVVYVNIAAFTTPEVTNAEVIRRHRAIYEQLMAIPVRELVVLIPPDEGYPLCSGSDFSVEAFYRLPPEAQALVVTPEQWPVACTTYNSIANEQRSWENVTHVKVRGPFELDGIHQTDEAQQATAADVRFVLTD